MLNYKEGKIYAIRSSKTEDIYIGSCCQKLCKKIFDYKKQYIKQKLTASKIKHGSYKIFDCGIDDAYIEILECYPCNNIEELKKREGEVIRASKEKCINRNVAMGLSKEQQRNLMLERQKKNRLNVFKCVCGEIVKTHLKSSHQENSKIHEDHSDKMYKKGLYPDGTPRDPFKGIV